MKIVKISIYNLTLLTLVLLLKQSSGEVIELKSGDEKCKYNEGKYFRLLSNNYDDIEKDSFWTNFIAEQGIGFKAEKDFGSITLLKDWSIYNFKLTKVLFRPYCTCMVETKDNCDGEMWLYHTKDNRYYSPGRRVHIKQNYFVIIVPLKIENDSSSIFSSLQLNEYYTQISGAANKDDVKVSPSRPFRLYKIIQNQPSFLFESYLPITNQSSLYMDFTHYHSIPQKDFDLLKQTTEKIFPGKDPIKIPNYNPDNFVYYRNLDDKEKLKPDKTKLFYDEMKLYKVGKILFILVAFLF